MARRSKGTSVTPPPRRARRGIRAGSPVRFLVGEHRVPAIVLEDRGPLANEGEHIFRIAIFPDDPEQRDEFEVQAHTLELA